MNFGRLRHRVTVQERSSTRDAYGQPADSWSALYSDVWAEVDPISARELIAGNMLSGEATHRVWMRYRAGVSTDNRILFGDRVLDVRSVRNINERGRWLELLCTEGVSNG